MNNDDTDTIAILYNVPTKMVFEKWKKYGKGCAGLYVKIMSVQPYS